MSERSALSNCHVLVTRPQDQAEEFCRLLRAEDAVPLSKPLIEIGAPDDFTQLDAALRNLYTYDWAIFASANAVQTFFGRAYSQGIKLDWGRTRIGAIGTATAGAVERHGLTADYVPSSFVAESLVAEFPGFPNDIAGQRVLWPKADIGRTFISDEFTAAGAHVQTVVCYTTGLPENSATLAQELRYLLESKQLDFVTFTSSQTVRNFITLLASVAPDPLELVSATRVAVIGPETALTAKKRFLKVDVVASEHTVPGLVSEMRKFAQKKKLRFSRRKEVN